MPPHNNDDRIGPKSGPEKFKSCHRLLISNYFHKKRIYFKKLLLFPSRSAIPGEPGKDYPIYSTNILCKLNPRNCGGGGGGGRGGAGGGRNKKKPGPARAAAAASPLANRPNKASASFQDQIAQGNIPGTPGKDYPVNSVDALRKRPGFSNLKPAPAHLVTPDYPSSGGSKRPPAASKPPPAASLSSVSAENSYCPGASLEECIKFCPSDETGTDFAKCVADCGTNC
jgi:hypothetical protein